ncbi:hypothetical protein D027_2720B, partial [Vibrio parahaemolyticus 861]
EIALHKVFNQVINRQFKIGDDAVEQIK